MPHNILVSSLFAVSSSGSIAVLLNIERKKALVASLGGGLSWLIYELALLATANISISLFMGSMVMGLYSEVLARRLKSPATIFYIPGFVPLVPGSNVYYSVLAAVQGQTDEAINQFLNTIIYSAAITLGLIIASAIVAIYLNIKRITLKTIIKEIRNH
ncbi:MAG: threonine/serine exporter family protein [Clostridiaceae bacterium]